MIDHFKGFRSLKPASIGLILLGSLIQALGIANIHAYSFVTEGGSLGLTLLIFHFTGLSPAISSLILNLFFYILGGRVMGKRFLVCSAVAVGSYSLIYLCIEPFAPLWPGLLASPLLCAITGAVFIGVGTGCTVLGGGAPAGDDALAMSLNQKYGFPIQNIYLVSDFTVLLLSLSYIPFRRIAYSLLTVFLSGQIIGWMQRLKTPNNPAGGTRNA